MKQLTLVLMLLAASACGKPGPAGPQGLPGDTGQRGSRGPQGPQGVNSGTGAAIQFCPSQGPSTYPTHFPEYGMCVDDHIYAVYSDSTGAWWTEVPPGIYASNVTGLTCNFVVNDNCQVTQ